ncbi:MAG: response regulator [Alphaproteobacteria bacterium]
MDSAGRPITILVAEDDADDRMMLKEAFEKGRLGNELQFVEDGEQLLDYLHRRGRFAGLIGKPYPALILLDLNMPKKDGREALAEIKRNPELRRIPVVILADMNTEGDILRTYDLGANSFITKPGTFDKLVKMVGVIENYWAKIVQLPPLTRSTAMG